MLFFFKAEGIYGIRVAKNPDDMKKKLIRDGYDIVNIVIRRALKSDVSLVQKNAGYIPQE